MLNIVVLLLQLQGEALRDCQVYCMTVVDNHMLVGTHTGRICVYQYLTTEHTYKVKHEVHPLPDTVLCMEHCTG